MTDHYYTPNPAAPPRPKEIADTLKGISLSFTTDAAVFSRDKIDNGTRLLIEQLPLPATGNVLDLGCGYGPIGLTIAKCSPDARVWLVDVNERAVSLAERNARRNGVDNAVVRAGDGFAPVEGKLFSLIVSNPPIRAGKRVIYPWVDKAFATLEAGGVLMLVARTSQGAKSLARKVADVFGRCDEVAKGSGYRVLKGTKQG